MRYSLLTYLFTLLVFNINILNAQTVEQPSSCESNSSYLDALLNKATEKDFVIIIARLGRKELSSALNTRRLHNVKVYLTKYRKGSTFIDNPKNLVLATGSKTTGLGIIEIYFKGDLFGKFYLRHNKDLYVGECVLDLEFTKSPCQLKEQRIFYPCLDKKS